MSERDFQYWLATSAVTFAGTVTTSTHSHGSGETTTYDADATLGTRADRVQSPVTLAIEERLFAKTKATLKLSDDGRLTGTDVASTGQGAKLLGAATTIAGLVAKAAGVFALAANLTQPSPSDEQPFPNQHLLEKLAEREDALTEQLADLAVEDASAATKKKFDLIDRALKAIAAQRDRLALEQAAWVAVESTSTVTHSYVLDLQQLPTEDELRAGLTADQPAKPVWDTLRIMAVIPEYTKKSDPHAELGHGADGPIQNDASRLIWYRRPRPTRISIFKRDEDGEIQLVRVTDVEVLDKHSRHFGLALGEDGLFRDTELNIVMGSMGTPTAITTSDDPGVATALAAAAEGPKDFTAGYADMSKLQRTLAPADPEAAKLDTLKAEKSKLQLQADIAKLKKCAPSN
jgi:hypothetical protein